MLLHTRKVFEAVSKIKSYELTKRSLTQIVLVLNGFYPQVTQHTRLTGKKPCASRHLSVSHLVTAGSHCTVRLGHSRACTITRSYRNGVFFFQILYSSLMTRSSTVSSSTAGRDEPTVEGLKREQPRPGLHRGGDGAGAGVPQGPRGRPAGRKLQPAMPAPISRGMSSGRNPGAARPRSATPGHTHPHTHRPAGHGGGQGRSYRPCPPCRAEGGGGRERKEGARTGAPGKAGGREKERRCAESSEAAVPGRFAGPRP